MTISVSGCFSCGRLPSLYFCNVSICCLQQDACNTSNGQSAQPGSGADRVVQAIAHTSLPLYGVQFHPESVGTAFGRQLLHNFAAITADWHGLPPAPSLVNRSGVHPFLALAFHCPLHVRVTTSKKFLYALPPVMQPCKMAPGGTTATQVHA